MATAAAGHESGETGTDARTGELLANLGFEVTNLIIAVRRGLIEEEVGRAGLPLIQPEFRRRVAPEKTGRSQQGHDLIAPHAQEPVGIEDSADRAPRGSSLRGLR